MKTRITIFLIILGIFSYSLNCGGGPDSESEKIIPPKFHTPENEGYWKGKAETHMPKITFTSSAKNEIEVTVPILQTLSPRHYIEVIVLVKDEKQVDSKKFEPSTEPPKARFKIDSSNLSRYSVVVKCNLHDMWRAPVKE